MDELVKKLKKTCEEIVNDPSLEPVGSTTKCNIAVHRICRIMGFPLFSDRGWLANEIYDYCKKNCTQVERKWASEFANSGGIALAAQYGQHHGHVAILYPGPMVYSGKWKMEVPLVANVGNKNGIMGVNYAFNKEPDYFVLEFGRLA